MTGGAFVRVDRLVWRLPIDVSRRIERIDGVTSSSSAQSATSVA